MDLEKYSILLQVLKSGSLSKAAEEHGYTVSGISRVISNIEKEQGFALLHRQRDGVTATKELEMLLPNLKEILYQESVISEISANIREGKFGTITIGIAYSNYYRQMADAANEFHKNNPTVKFQFVDGYSSELLKKMEAHEIDICLISQREGAHKWQPVGTEEIVVWIPKNHRLADMGRIPMYVLEEEAYIDIYPGKDIDNARLFQKYNINPVSIVSVQDSYAAYSMVEAGLGISLNHKSVCQKWRGDVLVKSLAPEIEIPVGLARNGNVAPVVAEFWEYIKEKLSL